MQEFKFRGQRVDTKEWVYGSLIVCESGSFIVEKSAIINDFLPDYNDFTMGCGIEDRGITDRYDACRHGYESGVCHTHDLLPEFIEVIPETVGQYACLKDKK